MKGHQEKEDLMKKDDRSFVISVTTLEKKFTNVMYLMINRILEVEHQYVSYVPTLDIQQSFAEWTKTSEIEGTMKKTLEIEGMMEEKL